MKKIQWNKTMDKPSSFSMQHVKAWDHMTIELDPFLTPAEREKVIGFSWTLLGSELDVNPTVGDCHTQLCLLIGSERFNEIAEQWAKKVNIPKYKYRHKKTHILYDGLDFGDDIKDYFKEIVNVK